MINITFYTFSKKENSTKRPTGTGTTYQCLIKEPSGILNPTIALDLGLSNSPNAFNYCYIQEYNRYYYVNEWTFDNALWYGSLSIDTLATAKEYIGDKDFYILRSANAYNGSVVDTKYPTLTEANSYMDSISTVTISKRDGSLPASVPNYFNMPLNMGRYYIGVTGANGTGVDWYVLSPNGFNTFANAIYDYTPADMGDVSSGIAKQIADPMQYIVNCYWLPYAPLGVLVGPRTIKLGYFSIPNVDCGKIDPITDIVKSSATFTIRKHPQANSRGKYLNNSPFSNYTIQFNPFGSFSLDASLMIDDTTIDAEWYVDYTTGLADLTLKASNTLLANTQAQMGTPIQLNQAIVDMIGVTRSTLTGAIDVASGLLTGNYGSAIAGAVGGYIGATMSKQPKITSLGGGGNFLPFSTYTPKIYSDFYYIADEFNAEIGRPLCEVRKPNNLGGYIVVLDGSIEAPLTKSELIDINNYLTTGFFYE